MSQHHVQDNYQMEQSRYTSGRNALTFAVLLSVLACIAGYMTDSERFFRSYLVAFSFTSAIGIASFFFVMVQYLSGSAWSVTLRRIMENIMTTLPWGLILFVPVALGINNLYQWTNPTIVAANEALRAKSAYLSHDFFIYRTIGYFALWSLWIFNIYRNSTKQDTERSAKQMNAISAWSGPSILRTPKESA